MISVQPPVPTGAGVAVPGGRRRTPRLEVYGARVTVDGGEIRLLNLSGEGLAVEGESRLEVGRTYRFTLRGDSGEDCVFAGAVVWCRSHVAGEAPGARPIFRAGIQRVGKLLAGGGG